MEHRTTRPHTTVAACRIWPSVVALAVLAQTGSAQVDRVIDGDTIRVRRDGARFTAVNVHSSTPRRAPRAAGEGPTRKRSR